MKIGRLRKATSFWKSLFFERNVCKMRECLMGYLEEEGIKCELVDGDIVFEFDEFHFTTSIIVKDNYCECFIYFRGDDDDDEILNTEDKAYMANKVNTDIRNHATVRAFGDGIIVSTSFYFTRKKMMIDLFSKHFEELTESLEEAIDIVSSKMEEQKKFKSRRIGFNIEAIKPEEIETGSNQVSAKA